MRISYLIITIFILCSIEGQKIEEKKIEGKKKCRKSPTESSSLTAASGPFCAGTLIFQDEFNTFDFSKWQHELYMSVNSFEWFVNNRTISFVKKGILHIRPGLTADKYGPSFLTDGEVNIGGNNPVANQCIHPVLKGKCNIDANSENIVNPVFSASIRTLQSFNFKYGKLEIKAKLSAGDWIWPQIELVPKHHAYGPSSGSIILLESRGNRNLAKDYLHIGVQQFRTKLSYYLYKKQLRSKSFLTNSSRGFDYDFHIYSMIWTPKNIKFYLDNKKIGIVHADDKFIRKYKFDPHYKNTWLDASRLAPFDEEFYISIRLRIGGTTGFFPDSAINKPKKPWLNTNPTTAKAKFWLDHNNWLPSWHLNYVNNSDIDFQIDYVRVYAL